jgi:hypothetical protein
MREVKKGEREMRGEGEREMRGEGDGGGQGQRVADRLWREGADAGSAGNHKACRAIRRR